MVGESKELNVCRSVVNCCAFKLILNGRLLALETGTEKHSTRCCACASYVATTSVVPKRHLYAEPFLRFVPVTATSVPASSGPDVGLMAEMVGCAK